MPEQVVIEYQGRRFVATIEEVPLVPQPTVLTQFEMEGETYQLIRLPKPVEPAQPA